MVSGGHLTQTTLYSEQLCLVQCGTTCTWGLLSTCGRPTCRSRDKLKRVVYRGSTGSLELSLSCGQTMSCGHLSSSWACLSSSASASPEPCSLRQRSNHSLASPFRPIFCSASPACDGRPSKRLRERRGTSCYLIECEGGCTPAVRPSYWAGWHESA